MASAAHGIGHVCSLKRVNVYFPAQIVLNAEKKFLPVEKCTMGKIVI